MKKIVCSLSVFVILLSSCNPDDTVTSPIITQDDILVKEIDFGSTQDWHPNYIQKFTYTGKKLSKVSLGPIDLMDIKYTYTGNLITSEEWISTTNTDFHTTYLYEYDANHRLEKVWVEFGGSGGFDLYKKYTYNADGTVLENRDATNQLKFYFNNDGDIIKKDRILSNGTITFDYTYDEANSPFINIIGLSKLRMFYQDDLSFNDNFHFGCHHNIKSIVSSGYVFYQVDYTYNVLFNIPLKSSFADSVDRTIQYY